MTGIPDSSLIKFLCGCGMRADRHGNPQFLNGDIFKLLYSIVLVFKKLVKTNTVFACSIKY